MEMNGGPSILRVESSNEVDDLDFSRLQVKPRIERQRSFDERSLTELTTGANLRSVDSYESLYSPGGMRSVLDTPGSSVRDSSEPHPMVAEAWEALRRSMVFFRGQPVGTIAAYDHASEEVLNYDQVIIIILIFLFGFLLGG